MHDGNNPGGGWEPPHYDDNSLFGQLVFWLFIVLWNM